MSPKIWSGPMHQSKPYPSHLLCELSLLSSQQSQSISPSRLATLISRSSMYASNTWRRVVVRFPSHSFHQSSHSFSMELQIEADMSCFMYLSRHMAIANMLQFLAMWSTCLHAAHWTSGRKGCWLQSGRVSRPRPRPRVEVRSGWRDLPERGALLCIQHGSCHQDGLRSAHKIHFVGSCPG